MKTAHHTRIKFLFNLLFHDLEPLRKKTKEERRVARLENKDYINLRKRYWRKEINNWQSDKVYKAKRKTYGNICLNPEFEGSTGHHTDKQHVINIPLDLHKSYWHSTDVPESMIEINWEAFKFLMSEMIS